MSREKSVTLLAHLIGWLLFFGLLTGFLYNAHEGINMADVFSSTAFLIFAAIYLFVYYFNTGFLVPRLYLQRKYLLYAGIILLMLLLIYFLKPFDGLMENFMQRSAAGPPPDMPDGLPPDFSGDGRIPLPLKPKSRFKLDIMSIILYVMTCSLGLALCIIREWRSTEQRALKAETEKVNAELSFLKAQINPHFLFNTLNNIYSMVMVKNDKAGDAVLKLSNIMRYITDEINTGQVPLETEIGCMHDYIDLQRMRLGAKTTVEVTVTGDTGPLQVAPLLLMTFVENAFKFGVSNHEAAAIVIRVETFANEIRFYCRNRLFPLQSHADRHGIGIANARQRLLHLYPDRHSLQIAEEDGFFTVHLSIQPDKS